MREGLKLFTNYTNQWKGQNKQERIYSEKAESYPYTQLIKEDKAFEKQYGLNYRKKTVGNCRSLIFPNLLMKRSISLLDIQNQLMIYIQ